MTNFRTPRENDETRNLILANPGARFNSRRVGVKDDAEWICSGDAPSISG